MTTPLKVTRAQARRLERNLGAPALPQTNKEMSEILTILWHGWEMGKGRLRTVADVNKLAVPMMNAARRYIKKGKLK